MADEKLVPGEEVRNAIVDVEVVKVKVDHIASSFDKPCVRMCLVTSRHRGWWS